MESSLLSARHAQISGETLLCRSSLAGGTDAAIREPRCCQHSSNECRFPRYLHHLCGTPGRVARVLPSHSEIKVIFWRHASERSPAPSYFRVPTDRCRCLRAIPAIKLVAQPVSSRLSSACRTPRSTNLCRRNFSDSQSLAGSMMTGCRPVSFFTCSTMC